MERTFGDPNHQAEQTKNYLDNLSKVVDFRKKLGDNKKKLYIP
jgi:hypothetical protein